ncbi:hypothetical protein Cde04nite_34080 [Cellulomonas denverensis]|nr:hypothetical protein Cde04nite_34080 [Cellulomonas denverensis]
MITPPCPRCGWTHGLGTSTTVAGPRFALGPPAYRARYPGAPSRPTRQAAMQDMCDRHAQHDDTKENDR